MTAAAALADPSTATLLGAYRRRVRTTRRALWLWPLLVVAWLALELPQASTLDAPTVTLDVVFVALAVTCTVASAVVVLRLGRWLATAEVTLANEPWRAVPAKVLSWDKNPVLELAGLGCVQLVRGLEPVLRTIELTGGVEVVGPAPSGWASVRVAGMCWPLPARVVARPPTQGARPPIDEGTDPITASLAAVARRRVFPLFVMPGVFTVAGAVLFALGLAERDGVVVTVIGACLVVLGGVSMVKALPSALAVMRLPAQLAAAPWTVYPAQLDQWQAPRGWATVTGRLQTPFGDTLVFELPRANYDLLVAIAMTGTMHVAGTPEPGAELPVGVPERPVLGYARFRAAAGRT